MATTSDVSVGLAHELTITTTKAGWEPRDFATLAQNEDKAREILAYLRGFSEIKPFAHVIDCDAEPIQSRDSQVEEHRKGGTIIWDAKRSSLYVYSLQKSILGIQGVALRRVLDDTNVLNANVLDYLLKNPFLIPEEWKSKDVFFWGTVYRNYGGDSWVRYLFWNGYHWIGHYRLLAAQFFGDSPAVVYERQAS